MQSRIVFDLKQIDGRRIVREEHIFSDNEIYFLDYIASEKENVNAKLAVSANNLLEQKAKEELEKQEQQIKQQQEIEKAQEELETIVETKAIELIDTWETEGLITKSSNFKGTK